jgi:hypothetical protein
VSKKTSSTYSYSLGHLKIPSCRLKFADHIVGLCAQTVTVTALYIGTFFLLVANKKGTCTIVQRTPRLCKTQLGKRHTCYPDTVSGGGSTLLLFEKFKFLLSSRAFEFKNSKIYKKTVTFSIIRIIYIYSHIAEGVQSSKAEV